MAPWFALDRLPLLANMTPAYRVTASPELAPLYAVIAGIFLSLAIATMGYLCMRLSQLPPRMMRILAWVIAGCISIGWLAAWIWWNIDHGSTVTAKPIWDLAPGIIDWWYLLLFVMVIAGVILIIQRLFTVIFSPIPPPEPPTEPLTPPDRSNSIGE